jgi:HK97 family phage portal protein
MAILDRFRTVQTNAPFASPDVSAADLAPVQNLNAIFSPFGGYVTATREEAMSIPTIARARNIICSAISSIPFVLRDRTTGERLDAPRVINQPDFRIPGQATWAWVAEDLLFSGFSYLQILEEFADTTRVRTTQRIAPQRVAAQLNSNSTEIIGYTVDGYAVPNSGVGSLVVFYGNDEGLLNRAGRTIRTAAALERAVQNYANEPIPSMVLKSNGSALPSDRIAKLLEQWSVARRNRSTAFLNADISMETVGFSPEQIGLNQARDIMATECARAIGIPAYFLDAPTGSSMTYSNAVTARQTLLDFSLITIANSLEQRLSQGDFIPSSQVVRMDFDAYLRGSALERAQIYEIYNRIGVMTADEIMRKEDMAL